MKKFIVLLICLFTATNFAQSKNPVNASEASVRKSAFEQRQSLNENSLVKNVKFRNVGPTVMSGRITDLDVNPTDPTEFYVAYASGGLWKTSNNGISFSPLFDNQPVMTIGDIAVDWINNIIYVGTGEDNSSRSSYAGNGIYKSTDDGKSWEHLGLDESHRIGRIVIHPENSEVIWVAALGHLYSPNPERGIYKSTDGGKTWAQTLFVNPNTGGIDLLFNPKNPNELFASLWHRERRAWNFVESGEGSGIYKSNDAGETWNLISKKESGFPTGEGVGRIGLNLFSGETDILFAFLDNQNRREKEEAEKYPVTKEILKTVSKSDFLNLEQQELNDFLDRNNFPQKYNAEEIFEWVQNDKIKPSDLVEYLADANTLLFDTPVIGAEVYKSTNGGKNWERTHKDYIDDLVFSYGYYFGEIVVSQQNPDKIIIMGVPIVISEDGGKTWESINEDNVHADHHALWINPNNDNHMILGNDGGLNISYDSGESWFKANTPAVGQFYTVNVDMEKPYNVYGGLQDNGVWYGPSNYEHDYSWYQSGEYPYKGLMGGDGMQVAVDTRDNNTIYTGYQFGNYFRINKENGDTKYITPQHELGESPYRFNWQSPIHISAHNMDIIYFGSHMLHRSLNKGETWENISGDLTKGGKKGDVPYGTLTTIDESPLKFGLIYVGSDDGLIHVTKDGGYSWQKISDPLPQNFWVSRVEASNHDEGTVYISLNGYRWDNFESMVYKSTNYGESWERIGTDLPQEPVNIIKEDPKYQNLLYVGTDHALYISLDGGKIFMGMNNNLPDAPVHDLVIHPRDNDVVVGTHGRSIYIADVEHLQNLDSEMFLNNFYFFDFDKIKFSSRWGNKGWGWSDPYEPKLNITFYSKVNSKAKLSISTESDLILKELEFDTDAGLNFFEYDLTLDSNKVEDYLEYIKDKNKNEEFSFEENDLGVSLLQAGKYKVKLSINGETIEKDLVVEEQQKQKRKKQKKTP
ncbi:MAG: hypothetical protein K9J12_17495 [Melioribacteraceae bacterium]|nr:hypothetical protein [Melioribacteraceae bacterium]MCF8262996.1 hypothetical protein [Melioribacteraceae bacterium]MCF8413990.1 hypothetical protein [Melioribacteraceae bacterium]MCF8430441.1 hypothetical protein [Melioribacteraceae bacterium]